MIVTLFTSRDDAAQWRDPVATAGSGPQRHGSIMISGLTPDTEYWFRFSDADGRQDPYILGGPARTTPQPVCAATATIDAGWEGGFVATVTVRNTGAEPIDGWRVWWRWSGDERIQSAWNATLEEAGTEVVVRNAPYNGSLAPGGSTSFGLLAAASAVPDKVTLTCGR